MFRRYRKTWVVIITIFLLAALSVAVTAVVISQNGLRYYKSKARVKYFGNVTQNGDITSGRLWFESDSAKITRQKFYIVEAKDATSGSYLPDKNAISILKLQNINTELTDILNNSLPEEVRAAYPFNNFIFNSSNKGISLKTETFETLIKNYEKSKIFISGGEIYTLDGIKWDVFFTETEAAPSYKNVKISQTDNNDIRYGGDITDFINSKDIDFATFKLSNGALLNLYSAEGIYKINFDKGSRSGETYIGKLNDNYQKSGKGLYYYGARGDIYYGDFLNDEKTGLCEVLTSRGDKYAGSVEKGAKNGFGVIEWSDGSSYSGEFKDNMKNGKGINHFADGSVYEGDFLNDAKHGLGKYIWASGDCYDGEYENDIFKGKGMYTWANNEYYVGDFDFNTMHGWGVYYWTSGRSYEGWWNMGKMVMPEEMTEIDNN